MPAETETLTWDSVPVDKNGMRQVIHYEKDFRVEVFCDVLIPALWNVDYQGEASMLRDDFDRLVGLHLSGKEAQRLLRAVATSRAHHSFWPTSNVASFWLAQVLVNIVRSVRSVSDVGTAWRLMSSLGLDPRGKGMWLSGYVPAEVVGRYLEEDGLLASDIPYQGWVARCVADVQRRRKSLVGLPTDLVIQLAGTQRIPKAWFTDTFPVPADITWVAPGLRKDEVS